MGFNDITFAVLHTLLSLMLLHCRNKFIIAGRKDWEAKHKTDEG
jgi:hypothetical protein